MQKQILSTCLAISLIANSSYVFADRSITGGSSSSTTEMSDGEAAAFLGGLLLLGGLMNLHSQSVVKAEEEATRQATKTIELKPNHTYVWSTGADDKNPIIEYVESCNPAKQYTVKANVANGVAEISDTSIATEEMNCSRTYDIRQKAVQEYADDRYTLKNRLAQAEAEAKARKAKREAERQAEEARAAEADRVREEEAIRKGCTGIYPGLVFKVKGSILSITYKVIGLDQATKRVTVQRLDTGSFEEVPCANVHYHRL